MTAGYGSLHSCSSPSVGSTAEERICVCEEGGRG